MVQYPVTPVKALKKLSYIPQDQQCYQLLLGPGTDLVPYPVPQLYLLPHTILLITTTSCPYTHAPFHTSHHKGNTILWTFSHPALQLRACSIHIGLKSTRLVIGIIKRFLVTSLVQASVNMISIEVQSWKYGILKFFRRSNSPRLSLYLKNFLL